MEIYERKNTGLSALCLKYYAVIAMVIDHIAWWFVPTDSVLGYIMHIVGRTTAPIMCFFIVEGFHHTKNVKKYLFRMLIFSAISWFPYYMYHHLRIPSIRSFNLLFGTQSVIYNFCLALIVLIAIHSDKMRPFFKILVLLTAIYLSMNGDWGYIIIFWVLIFDRYRGDFKKNCNYIQFNFNYFNNYLRW